MNSNGFTLMGMAVTVATIGILAVMAKPAVEATYARARQAEAKTILAEIKAVQTAHIRVSDDVFGFDKFGYIGGGQYKCTASDLPDANFGWRPTACETLRYNYTALVARPPAGSEGGSGLSISPYEIVAHAPGDQGSQYIWVGCNGDGMSIYGHSSGDVWRLRMGGNPEMCRNIRDFCPDVSANARARCDGDPLCTSSCTGCSAWTPGSWGAWSPSTGSVCSGTSFTQQRSRSKQRSCSQTCVGVSCGLSAADRTSRTATGSMSCAPPPAMAGGGGGGGAPPPTAPPSCVNPDHVRPEYRCRYKDKCPKGFGGMWIIGPPGPNGCKACCCNECNSSTNCGVGYRCMTESNMGVGCVECRLTY